MSIMTGSEPKLLSAMRVGCVCVSARVTFLDRGGLLRAMEGSLEQPRLPPSTWLAITTLTVGVSRRRGRGAVGRSFDDSLRTALFLPDCDGDSVVLIACALDHSLPRGSGGVFFWLAHERDVRRVVTVLTVGILLRGSGGAGRSVVVGDADDGACALFHTLTASLSLSLA